MASVSCEISEDPLLCFICKKVFTDPVTPSCGHSFCKICINKHWDQSEPNQCPVCKKEFKFRPKLKTNIALSEIVTDLKKKRKRRDDAEPETSESNCKVKKLEEQTHRPIPAEKNMEERICPEHGKPFMELFCRDHSQLICIQCFSAHQKHNIVTLMDKCKDQQSELQQKIQEREEKIQDLQRSVELSQENADREMKEGVDFFNDLMKSVQQSLDQFKKSINKKHQDIKKKAEVLTKEIKSEISVLQQRRAQMQVIWSSEDYFNFVQTFTLKPAPKMNDWTKLSVRAPSYHGRVAKAVSELQVKKLNPKIKEIMNDELKQAKKHAVDVTLDRNTAHPDLVVSKDNKKVNFSKRFRELQDTPERFLSWPYVCGRNRFHSGRFYFEVQVNKNTKWYLGVVKESADRRGDVEKMTKENGFWEISSEDVHEDLWSAPEKVGVLVDYEEDLVCFFDADSSQLVGSFTDCCFTENLLPLLSPGDIEDGNNSAPLILTPVALEEYEEEVKEEEEGDEYEDEEEEEEEVEQAQAQAAQVSTPFAPRS